MPPIEIRAVLCGAVLTAALASAAMAQAVNPGNPASLPASATANILKPIKITEQMGLHFGRILPPTSNVTDFTVDGADGISTLNSNGQALGGHKTARFKIEGQAGQAVNANQATIGSCTQNTVALNAIQTFPPPNLPVVFDANGEFPLAVGGTLRVGQASPGIVTCNYTVTISYQ